MLRHLSLLLCGFLWMGCAAESSLDTPQVAAEFTPTVIAEPTALPRPTRTPRPPKWDVTPFIGRMRAEVDEMLGAATRDPSYDGERFWYQRRLWRVTYEDGRAMQVRLSPENYLDPKDLRELGIDSGAPDRDNTYQRRWNSLPGGIRVSIIGYKDDGYGVTGQWQVEYVDIFAPPEEK